MLKRFHSLLIFAVIILSGYYQDAVVRATGTIQPPEVPPLPPDDGDPSGEDEDEDGDEDEESCDGPDGCEGSQDNDDEDDPPCDGGEGGNKGPKGPCDKDKNNAKTCPAEAPPDSTAAPPGATEDPILLIDGSVAEVEQDFVLLGPSKLKFSHRRTYNSRVIDPGRNGNGWSSGADMRLVDSGTEMALQIGSNSQRVFQVSGSTYTPPANSQLTLEHDAMADEFILTEQGRQVIWKFHDFTVTPTHERGRLKEQTNRQLVEANESGLIFSYASAPIDNKGVMDQVTTGSGQDYTASYTHSATGLIEKIEIHDSNSVLIQDVTYTYGGDVTGLHADVGTADDLVMVRNRKKDSSGGDWIETYTHYRYHSQGVIKSIFETNTVWRVVDAVSGASTPEDLLEEPDSSVASYADRAFTYYGASEGATDSVTTALGSENLHSKYINNDPDNVDAEGWVKSETIGKSAGSGCCGQTNEGGIRKDYYYITSNSTSTSTDPHETKHVIVEDTVVEDPGGDEFMSRRVFGLNGGGNEIRRTIIEDPSLTTNLKAWCVSTVFDDDYQLTEKRHPSAHDVTTETNMKKFLDPYTPPGTSGDWTNDSDTLRDTEGWIRINTYNADGYRNSIQLKCGESGTPYYTWAAEYGDGTDDKPKDRQIATYEYPTQVVANGSHSNMANGNKTSYARTFHDTDDLVIKTKTITFPSVGGSENGPGVSAVAEKYYDELGRLRWYKNPEGYVTYTSYHPEFGSKVFQVVDADPTALPDDADDHPTKWVIDDTGSNKPTRGAGLPTAVQAVGSAELDNQGREFVRSRPHVGSIGSVNDYTIYEETRTIRIRNWDGTQTLEPAQVTERDEGGRTTETYSLIPSQVTDDSGSPAVPTGIAASTPATHYTRWTKYSYDSQSGELLYIDRYHDIPNGGFYRTAKLTDRADRTQTTIRQISGALATANCEVTQSVLDIRGRVVESKRVVGTVNLSGTAGSSITVPATTLTALTEYDDGGVGDGYATLMIGQYDTGATDNTGTKMYYTYRGQLRGSVPIHTYNPSNGTSVQQGLTTVHDLNWRGDTVATAQYTAEPTWTFAKDYGTHADTTGTNRVRLSTMAYDVMGRMYRSEQYEINESSGAKEDRVQTDTFYDRRGMKVATVVVGGAKNETAYDGLGRAYQRRTSIESTTPTYSSGAFQYDDPQPEPSLADMSGGNDKVVTIQQTEYDDHGNKLASHSLEVNHVDLNGGIDMDSSDENYIRRTIYRAYDSSRRPFVMADYGSGGADWGYYAIPAVPTSIPTSSSSVHVSSVTYTIDGLVDETTDASGKKMKYFYDNFGRPLFVADSYDDFGLGGSGPTGTDGTDTDLVTYYVYDGLDNQTAITILDQNGDGTLDDNQTTLYERTDSYNPSLVTKTTYPDGNSGTSDNVIETYYLDGSPKTKTDQRGTTIETEYDFVAGARLPELQKVTALGGSTDGTVRSIKRAYDAMFGRVTSIQSFASSDGSGTPLNEVAYEYDNNLHGMATVSKQSHSGAWTSGDPEVTYTYDETNDGSGRFDEGFRATSITYPSGKTVEYEYTGTANGALNWISKIKSDVNSGSLFDVATYERSGSGSLVEIEYPGPAITHAYDEANDGTYEHRDRFGHTLGHGWKKGSGYLDRHDYTYDLSGNRLTRSVDDTVNSTASLDETFTYDSADRLETFTEGTTLQRDWELDALGNWESYSGTSSQTRTHNVANELSTISTWQNPVHDAAGNMTEMPIYTDPANSKYAVKYDAWNRPVEFNLVGTNLLVKYQYDGLNRRISKTATSGVITFFEYHFYYSQQWQVLETVSTVGSTDSLLEQQVWHPHYVDALAVRTYDGGSGLVSHYALQDANFNMVALTDTSGNVTERYDYSPYGELKVLDADFSADADGVSDVANPYTYTGRRYDPETGLYYFRNRYYYAQLGRFCSRDPIGYEGSPWNLYEYVSSAPIHYTDPEGLTSFDDSGCESSCPTSDTSGCSIHEGTTFIGFDAKCVCECAGESDWDNQVRGCLDCAERAGVEPTEAHSRCYALADEEHGFLDGLASRLDIGIRCLYCKNDIMAPGPIPLGGPY